MAPNGDPRPPTLVGATLSGVGLFLSVISLTSLSAVQSLRVFWFCLGLAFFVSGIATFAYAAYVWRPKTKDWGFPVTFGALTALIAIAVWAAQNGSVGLLAVCAGAIGGVIHEVAQSNGKIVLPGKQESDGQTPVDSSTQAHSPPAEQPPPTPKPVPSPNDNAATPDDDELYLGTLSGMFLGAVAGALILSATQQAGLSLGLTAFTAGLALKGVSEAVSTAATH